MIVFLDSSKTCRQITWFITAYLGPLTLMTFWMDIFTGPISVDYLLDLSLRQVTHCLFNPPTTSTAHPAVCLRVASPEVTSIYFLYVLLFFFLCWVFPCLLKELRVGHEPLWLCFCKALWDIDSTHYLTEICWKQTGKVHLHHLLRALLCLLFCEGVMSVSVGQTWFESRNRWGKHSSSKV